MQKAKGSEPLPAAFFSWAVLVPGGKAERSEGNPSLSGFEEDWKSREGRRSAAKAIPPDLKNKSHLCTGYGVSLKCYIRNILFIAIDQTGKQFSFPVKTFLVNIIGCFALGLFYGMADKGQFIDNQVILFLTIGLCGGFTTFSAFSHDNIVLIKNGNFMIWVIV